MPKSLKTLWIIIQTKYDDDWYFADDDDNDEEWNNYVNDLTFYRLIEILIQLDSLLFWIFYLNRIFKGEDCPLKIGNFNGIFPPLYYLCVCVCVSVCVFMCVCYLFIYQLNNAYNFLLLLLFSSSKTYGVNDHQMPSSVCKYKHFNI